MLAIPEGIAQDRWQSPGAKRPVTTSNLPFCESGKYRRIGYRFNAATGKYEPVLECAKPTVGDKMLKQDSISENN